jgi:hypothetical protein
MPSSTGDVRLHRARAAFGLAVALALSFLPAAAHQGHGPIALDELARNALVIVEGKVERATSAWNAERTQIRTTVRLKVDAFYKGDDGSSMLEIVLLGGVVGEDGLAIVGQPEFKLGERVFVFLRADWKANDAPVVAMEHGKFTIGTNAAGAELIVNAVGERYSKAEVVSSIAVMNAAGARP